MNEKYYTPEKIEFHEGFEFERKGLGDSWEKAVWEFHQFSEGRFNANLTYANSIRVKFLNREDIESFGFKHVGKTIDNWYDLEGHFEIPMSNHKNMLVKMQHDFRTHQGIRIVGYEYTDILRVIQTLYRGSCKNKSEFKKILIQIGII